MPADLTMRFLARLIDYILLGIVLGIVVFALIIGVIMGAAAGFGGFGGGGGFGVVLVQAVLTAGITLAYFALMESSRGQTVGKMLLKLQTQGPNGQKPTMAEAVRRNAWTALGILAIIPFFGGFLAWIAQLAAAIYIAVTINNNTTTRQGWHDEFAGGTRVIKIG